MRALTSGQIEALASRSVMRRLFVWVEPKDMATGDPAPVGFWDDVGSVQLAGDGRTFHGSGTLRDVSALSFASNYTVPGMVVVLGGLQDAVNETVRTYRMAQAPIEVMIGIFDIALHALIDDPVTIFRGYVDDVAVKTPAAGGVATIELTCESMSRQLTVSRPGTRSPALQRARLASDGFYDVVAQQPEQRLYFGSKGPRG